ncbi:hypothetical protein SSS_02426 [Sarcoptes scabiei]|uniref:Non-structural maintenance of chromosomes element 1 homolog n=1 Tax=Sarcoptes scabiei TaxID=52283 RepID=A0A834R4Y9_SARSC|nr:hypothetical protein SSS_02426 [Sarcoptes scabiei]
MVAKFEKLKLKFSYLNSNMTTNSQTKDVQSRHLFVQFFLKNQCVPERNLNTFVKELHHRFASDKNFSAKDSMVTSANRIFRNYGFIIKKFFFNPNQTTYYILMNEIDDSQIRQNVWPQKDNSFFHLVIDSIVEKKSTSLSTNMDQDEIYTTNSQFRMGLKEAINLTGELNLPMIVGEKMIMNWIYEHWFYQINTGTITLGPRVLAEKADYLEQKHHLPKCSECYIICLGGHKCPDCLKFIHESCSDSLQKCIDCRTDLLLNQSI